MTTIFASIDKYTEVRKLFNIWITDLSSEEYNTPFHVYWNRRIDSPKMTLIDDVTNIQLSFDSEEKQTFWLLKNT
jgi:hypothetical protein